MPGAMQSFFADLGWSAESVREVKDFARVADHLGRSCGIEPGVFVSLLVQATADGFARSPAADAVVVREGDGFVLAARRAPSEPAWRESMHEISNALTAVAGWVRIARCEGSATSRGEQALAAIEDATLLAIEQTRLANGVRTTPTGLTWHSVGAAIAQAALLVEPLAGERKVTLSADRGSELRVPVSRSALVSAITNLAKNAIEASQAGDVVHVSASATASPTGGGEDCGVQLTVRGGRAQEVPTIGRSTKGPGRGVGLQIVQSVARGAGGGLQFSLEDGVALATLSLTGRRSERPAGPPSPPRPEAETGRVPRGSGTRPVARRKDTAGALRVNAVAASVLVVDDEPSIRELVTTALELAGIHAHGIESPDDLDPRDRRTFSIALVDLRLGARDGLSVARALVKDGWARRFALMTGAPLGHVPDDAIAVVKKPFDIDDVIELVHQWSARTPRERKAR